MRTHRLYQPVLCSSASEGSIAAAPARPALGNASSRPTGDPLALVRLSALMKLSAGRDLVVGLIDGPVAVTHPDLADAHIREISASTPAACTRIDSVACAHGTFVAGILSAKRDSGVTGICPDCRLLVRPIFPENGAPEGDLPSATPSELSQAIIDCVHAGAHVVNMSAALGQPSAKDERVLIEALDYASTRGVLIVAAAGNQGTLGSSSITRHPWVIPVVACDIDGRPSGRSNLGPSIGKGLMAPGERVRSLGVDARTRILSGTSAAAPFVTGAAALLWSKFPKMSAAHIKRAITQSSLQRRTIVPPLLNAELAYQTMRVLATGSSHEKAFP